MERHALDCFLNSDRGEHRLRFSESSLRLAVLNKPLKKEIWLYFQDFRNLKQLTSPYPAGAFFIFLHLLECYAEPIAQLSLAHAKQRPANLDAVADMTVDGRGLLFGGHLDSGALL